LFRKNINGANDISSEPTKLLQAVTPKSTDKSQDTHIFPKVRTPTSLKVRTKVRTPTSFEDKSQDTHIFCGQQKSGHPHLLCQAVVGVLTFRAMAGVPGVILKLLPIKRILAKEQLKSRYLETLENYAQRQPFQTF